jgi:hypothetical protein
VDLPFEVPYDGDMVELPPDSAPALDGHEQVVSYHVGEPWVPPPAVACDAVTVVPRMRYDAGRLLPFMYEVTYWRKVVSGGR